MKDMKCEECGTVLKTGIPDQDSRGYIWCRKCGLIYDPNHPMGQTINSLLSYASHNGLQNYIDKIRAEAISNGLRSARLMVSKL